MSGGGVLVFRDFLKNLLRIYHILPLISSIAIQFWINLITNQII